jgi:transposase InsO family protein
VPRELRKQVYSSLHSLAHPCQRASAKLVTQRFVWPSINKDCNEWAKACHQCQRNKISRYNISPIANFELPSQRFEHIHIDLVSLPLVKGFRQCLTIIDRFTRYPEAIPLEDGNTETVARALLLNWIARFGVPLRITSDQGVQFTSEVFRMLNELLGVKHLKTTPYHPQANGLVERLHRQLKAALLCHNDSWYDALPAVLMGLRAAWKEDISTTPAELVYGEPIRLPGEFLAPSNQNGTAPELVKRLRNHFREISPEQTSRRGNHPIFAFKDLQTCTHVFVKKGQIGPSFSSLYSGPHRVMERHEKYFVVFCGNKNTAISVDRLKPAYTTRDDIPVNQQQILDQSPRPTPSRDAPISHTVSPPSKRVRFLL